MKISKTKLLLAAAILAPSVTLAATAQTKSNVCFDEARMFSYIGAARDADLPPAAAYREALKNNNVGLSAPFSDERIKQMVNTAYFNPAFASVNLGNGDVASAIINACMQDWKPKYQPLK